MKHYTRRSLIALLLAVGMILSLCACGGQTAREPQPSQNTSAPAETQSAETLPSVSMSDVDITQTAGSFALGQEHAVAILSDGTAIAAGGNDFHQCDVYNWTDLVQIEAGSSFTVGLRSDATPVATGANTNGQCDVFAWENIVSIRAGGAHTVGLKSDGTVVATGRSDEGQCDVYSWTDITQVDAGFLHTVGLKSDGTVVAAGSNKQGECDVSGWTDIVQVAAGNSLTLGLKADGTVVYAGRLDTESYDVSEWTDIVMVAAGNQCAAGLKSDGSTTGFGRDVCALFASGEMMVAVHSDGTVTKKGSFKGSLYEALDTWTGIRVMGTDGSALPGTAPGGESTRTAAPEKPDTASLTESGQCGDQITWEYYADDHVLFISGQGDMWDYEKNQSPWTSYLVKDSGGERQIRTIVVESGVTSIGSNAFSSIRDSGIIQVFLPDGLVRIGDEAFNGADEMRWCPLPDTVAVIGDHAFVNCESWAGNIPQSLTALGERAFVDTGIQAVQIPGTLVTIPDHAFAECEHLQVVEMADGIVELGSGSFVECSALARVILPQTLVTIGFESFRDCDSLTSIHLPDSVSSMNRGFYLCDNLAQVNIPTALVEIESLTFCGCDAMETIHIPSTVLSVANDAFSECDQLSKITSDMAGTAAQLFATQKGIAFEVVE